MAFISSSSEKLSGIFFVVIGGAFLFLSTSYEFGTPLRMGPGFFPIILSCGMLIVGVATFMRSLKTPGEPIGTVALRGAFLIALSTVLFGVLVRSAGLVAALATVVFISAYASEKFSWKTATIMFVCFSAFCSLVFVYGIGLPIPLVGQWLRF